MGYRPMAGYQPELVCLLSWLPNDKIPILTDIAINSKYGLYVNPAENQFLFHCLFFSPG